MGLPRLRQKSVEIDVRALSLRALDVEEDGVRREPPPLQPAQSVPEAEARRGQGAVRAGEEALQAQGSARQLEGEPGGEGVVDQVRDLVRRVGGALGHREDRQDPFHGAVQPVELPLLLGGQRAQSRGVLLVQPLHEQGAEAGTGAVRPVVEVGVEILAGLEVFGDLGGPGVERLLHLLPLPLGGAGGGPGHDRQLGGAAFGVDRIGDGERGVAEKRLQPLRLGDQGGPRGSTQDAEPLLPGEPLRAGGRRAEPRAPGVRPLDELPARLGQPPRQRRVAVPRVGNPDGARRHHRAVRQETQAQLLADGSLEAGGQSESRKGLKEPAKRSG